MTPEQFAEIVAAGDLDEIAAAVAPLNEQQRRKLAGIATRINKELTISYCVSRNEHPDAPTLAGLRKRLGDRYHPSSEAGELAIMAVGSLSQAKSLIGNWEEGALAAFRKVVTDRKPEWLDRWVVSRLDARSGFKVGWSFLRPLIRDGICQRPVSESYVRWMAHAMPMHAFGTPQSLSQRLLSDLGSLDDVWGLFEVETWALETWAAALTELSQQGHVDRQRLLDASLKALSAGFKNHSLTEYIRFVDRLEPTIEELGARQAALLALLPNPASHVVTFAIEKLDQIDRAGKLDGEAYLAGVSGVFQTRTKGQPVTALRITERVVKRVPELVPHAVASAMEALSHSSADVQNQAIGLLEAWAARLHADHAVTLRERAGELAPTVRAKAEALLDRLGPIADQATPSPPSGDEGDTNLAVIVDAAEALPPLWRQRAGVDEALAAIRRGGMPGPFVLDLMDARVLTGVAAVVPIQTVGELVDAVAHAVETIDSPDEVERILDGISRLCDQRPADFERRTAPLVKRIEQSHIDRGTRGLATEGLAPESLYQLLMVWLRGEMPPPRHRQHGQTAIDRFFKERIQAMIRRIQQRQAAPLWAAPTHMGGWIAAAVLVERLTLGDQFNCDPGSYEFLQALLRLAPDGRAEALARAANVPGTMGRVVRWALGSDEGPTADDSRDVALWLAAGRARHPSDEVEELVCLGLANNLPDGITPARYAWHARQIRDTAESRWNHRPTLVAIKEQPEASTRNCSDAWTTVVLHDCERRMMFLPAWRIGMLAQIWPLCLEPFWVRAVIGLQDRVEQPASTLEPYHAYLRPLFEPDRPWSELAAVAVWVALVSKDADSRTTAMDVLIEAIADGRAHPEPMAQVLAKLAAGDWLKLNRVADALAEVARLSVLHAWFAAETLQGFLAASDALPRDAHAVLSLLHELLVDLGTSPLPAVVSRLEPVRGTSKTAKAAVSLQKLTPQPQGSKLRQAGLQALDARVARAKRWADLP